MIKDDIIRVFLSRWHEVPSLWSDSGKLDPISFRADDALFVQSLDIRE